MDNLLPGTARAACACADNLTSGKNYDDGTTASASALAASASASAAAASPSDGAAAC